MWKNKFVHTLDLLSCKWHLIYYSWNVTVCNPSPISPTRPGLNSLPQHVCNVQVKCQQTKPLTTRTSVESLQVSPHHWMMAVPRSVYTFASSRTFHFMGLVRYGNFPTCNLDIHRTRTRGSNNYSNKKNLKKKERSAATLIINSVVSVILWAKTVKRSSFGLSNPRICCFSPSLNRSGLSVPTQQTFKDVTPVSFNRND